MMPPTCRAPLLFPVRLGLGASCSSVSLYHARDLSVSAARISWCASSARRFPYEPERAGTAGRTRNIFQTR
ncbi:hypothetical protein E2C01_081512 [Portunus trituberculatus]|uniref:Secreted protein n=1 Tax=Portunus trituberculatus TaxID=210409 RepID=A0A5B7IYD7_PORTR|nr:hypothetical protein [Portunus trituberculatus]